jgi:hypothetical protein
LKSVSIWECLENPKCFLNAAYQIGYHNLKRTSTTPIVQSQHEYFFIPTTARQIMI